MDKKFIGKLKSVKLREKTILHYARIMKAMYHDASLLENSTNDLMSIILAALR